MRILELTQKECLEALTRLRFGRLACVRDDQPYVVPIYFAYHLRYLYSFAAPGQKIAWMRTNPLVCVEADDIINRYDWLSVIVQGRYEELLDNAEGKPARELTHSLLQQEAMWWEPAYARTDHHGATAELTPIYYRIHIDQVSGRQAKPDSIEAGTLITSAQRLPSKSWLRRLLRR